MDSPRPLGERYRESMNNVIDKYSNMDMDMDESEGESLGEEDSYSEEEEEEEPMQSQVAEGWPHRKRQKHRGNGHFFSLGIYIKYKK